MTGVIILAAGSGKRMNKGINKQFLRLNGEYVLTHTLRCFGDHPCIEGIVIACRQEDLALVKESVELAQVGEKIRAFVPGGKERQDSVRLALLAIPSTWQTVLIHDGARPFVSRRVIGEVAKVAQKGAVLPVVSINDSVKRLTEEEMVQSSVDRTRLVVAQTPQGFPTADIKAAHALAFEQQLQVTDDVMLFELLGKPVQTVKGDVYNLKITLPEDLILAPHYKRMKEMDL